MYFCLTFTTDYNFILYHNQYENKEKIYKNFDNNRQDDRKAVNI